jgi:Protein of unknown function (DUF3808)
MVGFVREGLAIRQSYSIFKSCYKYLAWLLKEQTENKTAKTTDPNSDILGVFEEAGVDIHFIQSVYVGMGSFNLILSTIPARLLRIFEMIGFGGHRIFGMKCLEVGTTF